MVIHKDSIKLLQELVLNNSREYIDKFRNYLGEIFNELIEKDYFSEFHSKELICIFINLWSIVKTFYPIDSPIHNGNKERFSEVLKRVSLANEELDFVSFQEFDLSYMDFSNTDLSETYFYNVNFSHSNFRSANLDAICWSGADLSYCDFESAFMECSHLEYCKCHNSSFKKSHLLSSVVSGADFSYTNLENTNFMECDADRLIVKGMKIDNKTAFNETDLRYVDWEDVDISGLSINENDVSHFWEVVNYTRNTILYDAKFTKLENSEIQNVIYRELKASSNQYLKKTKLDTNVPEIFISYASEEKMSYAMPTYKALYSIEENGKQKYSIWIDEQHLTIGDKLRQSIESVIKNCKLAIIFFSDSYAYKGWTRYELYRIIQEYQERNLSILLVDITKNEIDLDLFENICVLLPRSNQYYNVDEQKLFEMLVQGVNGLL